MQASDVIRFTPIVEREAGSFARNYPGTDREDIQQEIWVRLIADWPKITEKAENLEAAVTSIAKKVAHSYCRGELASYELHSAQFVYTNSDVRALFKEAYFEPSMWEQVPGPENKSLAVTDSNGVTVALWDLREVFDSLSEADQVWIMRAYHQQEVLDGNGRKAVTRAIDKVVDGLNRKVPRRKMTDNFDYKQPTSRTTSARYQTEGEVWSS